MACGNPIRGSLIEHRKRRFAADFWNDPRIDCMNLTKKKKKKKKKKKTLLSNNMHCPEKRSDVGSRGAMRVAGERDCRTAEHTT